MAGNKQSRRACVVEDFNFRDFDWSLLVGDSEVEEFLEVIQNNFKAGMLDTTRGNNNLDLFLTNSKEAISHVDMGEQLGNSEHHEVRYKLKWEEAFKEAKTLLRYLTSEGQILRE